MTQQIINYQCTICENIQQTNDSCQCCGNSLFEEIIESTNTTLHSTQLNLQLKRVVIIGGGIASISVIRQLLKSSQCSITLITKESRLPYYRTAIPKIIHNPSFESQKQFTIEQQSFFDQNHIHLLLETEVININIQKKVIYYQQINKTINNTINDNNIQKNIYEESYDDLVFATGGSPNIPSFIQQSKCKNIIPIHSVEHIQQIVKCFETNKITTVVIIGAGLSGIEIAAELRRKYSLLNIIMIEIANRILPRQLTEEASNVFTSILSQNNIHLLTSRTIQHIEYQSYSQQMKIIMNTGELQCDLICYSCGIHSNKELAEQIGCKCSRGIIVDDYMKTSIPSIYACGDCCEHNGYCYGNWTDAMKQGEICANSILGNNKIFIHTPMPYFVYCFIGVYSVGSIESKYYLIKQVNNQFMQLFYDESKSKLIGGILIGKIVSKIQRELVSVISNKITGNELNELIHQWEQYF